MDPVARQYLDRQIKLVENGGVTWDALEEMLVTLGRFFHYTTPEQGGWSSHRSRPGVVSVDDDPMVDLGTGGTPKRQPVPAQVHLDYLRNPDSKLVT